MRTLLIHSRRGLYQLTICSNCSFNFECENCDAKLVTYRHGFNKLELMCHQCQTYYQYPDVCPHCHSSHIISKFGGIDELVDTLEKTLKTTIFRLDQAKLANQILNNLNEIPKSDAQEFYVTTRIFDPGLPYNLFDRIIFIQADNLLASPDYLVQEEIVKSICEIFTAVQDNTEIIFDTLSPDIGLFQELIRLHKEHPEPQKISEFYLKFLEKEKVNRQAFGFPPFKNLLLLTSQEKSRDKAWEVIQHAQKTLQAGQRNLPEITVSTLYPARFLKRKNMFSYHILVRFPRQYEHFNALKKLIQEQSDLFRLQIRYNPKHLF